MALDTFRLIKKSDKEKQTEFFSLIKCIELK
jgi:hypothetical protein